jgi:hypothetical protein
VEFTFPQNEHLPSFSTEFFYVSTVTLNIRIELWNPIFLAARGRSGVLASLMLMPETTVHKNNLPAARKS